MIDLSIRRGPLYFGLAFFLLLNPYGVFAESTYGLVAEITQEVAPGIGVNSDVAFDGDTLVIGAPGLANENGVAAGAVHVFERRAEGWTKSATIFSDYSGPYMSRFGAGIGLQEEVMVVGAPYDGVGNTVLVGSSIHHFQKVDGQWVFDHKTKGRSGSPYGDYFGHNVEIDGDTMIVSAHNDPPGVIYVYRRMAGQWELETTLGPDDPRYSFGFGCDISGDLIVASGYRYDEPEFTYVFRRINGVWTQEAKLYPSGSEPKDYMWAVSVNGDKIVVGAHGRDSEAGNDTGAAYVFRNVDGIWTEDHRFPAPLDGWNVHFGRSVDIQDRRAVILSAGMRAVDIFDLVDESWVKTQTLTYSGPTFFAGRVKIHEDKLAVLGRYSAFVYEYDNQPPLANAGSDQVVQSIYFDGGATVSLDGSPSSDPDGDELQFTWTESGEELATGSRPDVRLGLGEHLIVLAVTDGSAQDTDEVLIVVQTTIDGIWGLLDEVVLEETLTGNTVDKLYRQLISAQENMNSLRPEKAIENLDEFIRAVNKAVDQRDVSLASGDILIGAAMAMQGAILGG